MSTIEYRRSDRNFGGTSFHDVYATASGKKLQKVFGKPDQGDGYKSHGQMTFVGSDGKHLSLYDMRAGFNPWESHQLYSFHIGCSADTVEDAKCFAKWLEKKLDVPQAKKMEKSDDIAFLMQLFDTKPEVQQLATAELKPVWQRALQQNGFTKEFPTFGPASVRSLYAKKCDIDKEWRSLLISVCKTEYETYKRLPAQAADQAADQVPSKPSKPSKRKREVHLVETKKRCKKNPVDFLQKEARHNILTICEDDDDIEHADRDYWDATNGITIDEDWFKLFCHKCGYDREIEEGICSACECAYVNFFAKNNNKN